MTKAQALMYAAFCLGFLVAAFVSAFINWRESVARYKKRIAEIDYCEAHGLPVPPQNQTVCK